MTLAAATWHVLESRAIERGIWGVPLAPPRLLDVDSTVFLAFVEGIVRESDENAESLNDLYDEARPRPKRPVSREERRRDIARFARITGGSV